jgi:two-component system, OmpR family, alkaline phosphatase synthesis response regulator PhoP
LKILLVEDDLNLCTLIKLVLKEFTEDVVALDNGFKAVDYIAANSVDLIILDIMIHGLNGMEVCKKVRALNILTPIIMLTSKSEEDDKLMGFEYGADDYVTKPFSNKELVARIKALLRRNNFIQKENQEEELKAGELILNTKNKSVVKANKPVEVTPKEYEILLLLMSNPNRKFSRMDLLDRIWGDHFEGMEHTVNSHMNRLRIKVEDNPSEPKYIMTAYGLGYYFNNKF